MVRNIRMEPAGFKCPEGYHLVMDHFRNRPGNKSMALEYEGEGVYVRTHCVRNRRGW